MDGTRRRRTRASLLVALTSVLALLALSCFPLLAWADSANDQYTEPNWTATGEHGGGQKPGSPASGQGTGSASISTSRQGSGSARHLGAVTGVGSSKGHPSTTAQPGPGGKGNTGERSPSNGPLTTSQAGQPVQSTGGGSSPLIPILIAIAALAAISIGVVAMRARRARPGGDTSVTGLG